MYKRHSFEKTAYILVILKLDTHTFLRPAFYYMQKSYVAPVFPHENLGYDICMADNNNIFIIGTTIQI